jgi:hypothetical protein
MESGVVEEGGSTQNGVLLHGLDPNRIRDERELMLEERHRQLETVVDEHDNLVRFLEISPTVNSFLSRFRRSDRPFIWRSSHPWYITTQQCVSLSSSLYVSHTLFQEAKLDTSEVFKQVHVPNYFLFPSFAHAVT